MKRKIFVVLAVISLIFILSAAKTEKPVLRADGYASLNGGTIGGSKALSKNIFTATNKAELLKALKNKTGQISNDPKIIFISGIIDICVDANNKPLSEKDFTVAPYSLEAYLAAYEPKVWGRGGKPSGALEDARKASLAKFAECIYIPVGSNTTIIGVKGAKILHGNLLLDSVSNVIIKNISFEDAYDFFPQWDPKDSYDKATDTGGRWNSLFDLISVVNSTNVWIDHCTFSDGDRSDGTFPNYLDQQYQHHDGSVDITKGSNYVTFSYNYVYNHDKNTLLGGSDSQKEDVGKLKVTFHHNYYESAGQRLPRVRFGEAHIYNNYYNKIENYAIGIGIFASIYAEANVFENIIEPASQIKYYDGKGAGYIKDVGNFPPIRGVLNESDGLHIGRVTWEPKDRYSYKADNTAEVKNLCITYAGADKPERK